MFRSSAKWRLIAAAGAAVVISGPGAPSDVRAGAYSDSISATPGLVGYWRLGEPAGNYADSSGQGNFGVVNGGVLQGVPGPRPADGFAGFEPDNAAAGFNSADGADYVAVADPASNVLDPRTGDLSVSLWFKGPNDGGDYMLIGKTAGTRDGYFFERIGTAGSYTHKLNVSMSPDSATPGIGPIGPVSDPDHWTNAVFVLHRNRTASSPDYQASGVSLFINGAFFGSDLNSAFDGSPGADMNNIQSFLIGAYRLSSAGADFSYTGTIDEVSVFGRALSPSEIGALYDTAATGVPEPAAIAAGWVLLMPLVGRRRSVLR